MVEYTAVFYANIAVYTYWGQLSWLSFIYDFRYSFNVECDLSKAPWVWGWYGVDQSCLVFKNSHVFLNTSDVKFVPWSVSMYLAIPNSEIKWRRHSEHSSAGKLRIGKQLRS